MTDNPTQPLPNPITQPLSNVPLWEPAKVAAYLAKLRVIDVWKRGNPSGYVTNPALYHEMRGQVFGCILHATAGSNSLWYLTEGAARDGRGVCADQLIAKDGTIYKLVPPGFYAWHAGPEHWQGFTHLNQQFLGFEIENLNNGKDPYTEAQYVTVAASWAYSAAEAHLLDSRLTLHRITAPTRRTDPMGWDLARFWAYVALIRKPEVWPEVWPVKLWYKA